MPLIGSVIIGDEDADYIGPVIFVPPSLTIPTSNGTDRIFGNAGADIICGRGGSDFIYGGSHADAISGGAGNDIIYGDTYNWNAGSPQPTAVPTNQEGKDSINGGLGHDYVDGGGGNDGIFGEKGNDTLYGGNGNDTLSGGFGLDTLDGGEGKDLLFGAEANDSISGGNGNDTLSGGFGNDKADGGNDNDLIFGGAGNDTLGGGAGNDTIDGGVGNDSMTGGDGNDRMAGGAGADKMYGDAGNDRLSGGDGGDKLYGGAGSDTLVGGLGGDTIDAGADGDADYIVYDEDIRPGADSIYNFDAADGDKIVVCSDDNVMPVLKIAVGDFDLIDGSDVKIWVGSNDGLNILTLYGAGNSFETQAANPDGSPLELSAVNAQNFLFVDTLTINNPHGLPDPNLGLSQEPAIPVCPDEPDPWLISSDDL